jgi:DNA-binding NarL/FixJ family response regulator
MPIILTPVLIAKASGRLCEGLISLLESQPSIQIAGVIHQESEFFNELTRYNQPCILIVDIDLFGETIFEICRKIKGEFSSSGCILLVNTIDERDKGYKAGAEEVLIKGYILDELLDAIQRIRYVKFLSLAAHENINSSFKYPRENL